jgi:hypothetical protein
MGDTLNAIPEGTRYFIFQFWEPHYSAFAGAKIPVD